MGLGIRVWGLRNGTRGATHIPSSLDMLAGCVCTVAAGVTTHTRCSSWKAHPDCQARGVQHAFACQAWVRTLSFPPSPTFTHLMLEAFGSPLPYSGGTSDTMALGLLEAVLQGPAGQPVKRRSGTSTLLEILHCKQPKILHVKQFLDPESHACCAGRLWEPPHLLGGAQRHDGPGAAGSRAPGACRAAGGQPGTGPPPAQELAQPQPGPGSRGACRAPGVGHLCARLLPRCLPHTRACGVAWGCLTAAWGLWLLRCAQHASGAHAGYGVCYLGLRQRGSLQARQTRQGAQPPLCSSCLGVWHLCTRLLPRCCCFRSALGRRSFSVMADAGALGGFRWLGRA